jgi:hypothetical protein
MQLCSLSVYVGRGDENEIKRKRKIKKKIMNEGTKENFIV